MIDAILNFFGSINNGIATFCYDNPWFIVAAIMITAGFMVVAFLRRNLVASVVSFVFCGLALSATGVFDEFNRFEPVVDPGIGLLALVVGLVVAFAINYYVLDPWESRMYNRGFEDGEAYATREGCYLSGYSLEDFEGLDADEEEELPFSRKYKTNDPDNVRPLNLVDFYHRR